MSIAAALAWSIPWIAPPVVTLLRARKSLSLDEVPRVTDESLPFVSVIVPARNERRNIERCARSVLATRYPAVEVIVVDDHSRDGTGDIARSIARNDERLHVIDAPPLPPDWFGKQWACATGAGHARGALLLFTDADTWHGPELLPLAVNALVARHADLVSVAGRQEMHSFWERIVQPQMFALLSMRYGGTEHVSNARRPADAIANGQFLLVRREAYDALGGHEAVRDRVAEDMSLAQEWTREGRRIALFFATDHISTHMYASLGEIVRGWRKNIYAAGRQAALGGVFGRALFPFILLAVPMLGLAPPVVLVLAVVGVLGRAWLVWSAVCTGVTLAFWSVMYRYMRVSVWYALLYPLGFAVLLYIAVGALVRGRRRVEWKERTYRSR